MLEAVIAVFVDEKILEQYPHIADEYMQFEEKLEEATQISFSIPKWIATIFQKRVSGMRKVS